ncbi:MAG: peptidylprolyl isomerase [Goleter apudmare HA4340-LM2]|jgi:parvulin-like peptidyl-prolyl isomerase|nr:peptidylprolyl isomerase [Goleter apudmare HA4340-LM2]
MIENLEKLSLPEIAALTDEEIITYLRHSCRIAEITASAQTDKLVVTICEQLGVVVADEELQAAGNDFRQDRKLLGISETLAWLAQQRITAEDWSSGIKVSLLTQKLKELLFGSAIDNHYMSNRNDYRRLALSQIVVRELTEAMNIAVLLQENKASFCNLALEYSISKQAKENGGFVGIRFLNELLPEIFQAVANASEGEVIGPIQTKLGYHILKVEKWFPAQLNEFVRANILESLFQTWLSNIHTTERSIK